MYETGEVIRGEFAFGDRQGVLVILLQIADAGVKRSELGVDVGMVACFSKRSSWKLIKSATLRTAASKEIFSYFSTKVMALPPVPQTKHLKICFSFGDVERGILVVVERAERNVAPAFLDDGDVRGNDGDDVGAGENVIDQVLMYIANSPFSLYKV
jgi:hypothetical protein